MLKVWPESKKYLLLQKERVKISIPFGKKQIIEFQEVKRSFLNLRDSTAEDNVCKRPFYQ